MAILLAAQVLSASHPILDLVIMPLVVSVIFSLIASIAFGSAWKNIATKSPNTLAKFYLAAPVLRMIAALAVVLIFAFVLKKNTDALLAFVAVFVGYYIVLLIFDSVFFSRAEKKLNLK